MSAGQLCPNCRFMPRLFAIPDSMVQRPGTISVTSMRQIELRSAHRKANLPEPKDRQRGINVLNPRCATERVIRRRRLTEWNW
jgi:hypothetical protein